MKSLLPIVFIFIEGDKELRPSFQRGLFFLSRKRLIGKYDFRVVCCGNISDAIERWSDHPRKNDPLGSQYLLLIDSEGPVSKVTGLPIDTTPFGDLNLDEKDLFFMVQLMESWYLARIDILQELYKQGFQSEKLPPISSIPASGLQPSLGLEAIDKGKMMDCLNSATIKTKNGKYTEKSGKTVIAPRIFEKLSLEDVAKYSWHANQLLKRLQSL